MSGSTFNFTKTTLLGLPSPADGQRATVHDTHAAGLELRVTSTGAKTFSWYRRAKNGPPQRVTIGRFPDTSVDQARSEAAKFNAALVDGGSPAAVRRERREEQTFGDLFDTYLSRHAKVHKKTWKEDQQRFDQYLAGPLGSVKLSKVTRETVARIHSSITTAGHAAVANRVLALVSSVFGRALEWSLVKDNPVKGIRRNREHSRDRFLQSHELPRFFAALAEEPNETTRDYITASLLTGARRANVLSMKWADINLADKVWRIPDTKNGEPQNVVLTGLMMELLNARRVQAPRSQAFVFPGTGAKGHLVEPHKAWIRIFDRDELMQIQALIAAAHAEFKPLIDARTDEAMAETLPAQLLRAKSEAKSLDIDCTGLRMEHLRIHDLRRTMGSWQAIGGESLTVIGKSLGHKNVATTAIYARLQLDPVRASMEKATEAMFAAGGVGK